MGCRHPCAHHPAAPGSSPKHTIYAFIIYSTYLCYTCHGKRTKINKKRPGFAHFTKIKSNIEYMCCSKLTWSARDTIECGGGLQDAGWPFDPTDRRAEASLKSKVKHQIRGRGDFPESNLGKNITFCSQTQACGKISRIQAFFKSRFNQIALCLSSTCSFMLKTIKNYHESINSISILFTIIKLR